MSVNEIKVERAWSGRLSGWLPLFLASLALASMSSGCASREAPDGAAIPMTIVAGDGTAGFRDGAEGRFNKPIRLAPFGQETVLVADIYNHALRLVTRQGRVVTLAGGPGRKGHLDGPAGEARLASPHGVAVSSSGEIAIAEAENHTVRLLTPEPGRDPTASSGYSVSTLAGVPGEKGLRDGPADRALFSSPHAVVWLDGGKLLVADIGNARLRLIDRGEVSTIAGGGAGQETQPAGSALSWIFTYPMDLALHTGGSILVADAGSHQILRWTASEGVRPVVEQGILETPHGVAADGQGRIYVAEMGRHRVVAVEADGRMVTVCGSGEAGSGPGQLNRPAAVLVHGGEVWVADLDNHRLVTCPIPG